jgi:hypothetical protein
MVNDGGSALGSRMGWGLCLGLDDETGSNTLVGGQDSLDQQPTSCYAAIRFRSRNTNMVMDHGLMCA